MVRLVNAYCDSVLCVSDRVRDIATRHGVRPDVLQTQYIGTTQDVRCASAAPRVRVRSADRSVTLGYLGYMRRDKGFFFLLSALESLPGDLAGQIRLRVAARAGSAGAMARLDALRDRLADVVHVNGYDHSELDDILAPVDVGVVPPLWEDNLPQVAVEMHVRGIPLLTSNRGGAQELANCPEMVFRAGDIGSFEQRLRFVLDGHLDLDRYWRRARSPVSMADHVDALLDVYRGAGDAAATEEADADQAA